MVYLCTSETASEVKQNTIVVPLPGVKKEVQLETQRAAPKPASSACPEYSFVHASNELMKDARELIHQHPNDKVLAQLFENICLLHGYVFSIILPLQQQKLDDLASESEGKLHLNNLNNVYDIFQTTKSLLQRNVDHFRHLQLLSTIRSSFSQFHNNVEVNGSISLLGESMPLGFFADSSQSMDEKCGRRQHAEDYLISLV